ncbi:MAG: hypothetical protein FWF94_07145 [Oscillospiraceae bacterium]|nr:hypothetical protein [Oscillospiraceae bacterium]
MPRALRIQITAFFLIISFSGCYWNTPVIDLISPPKLTGEQTEIFNALINSRGSALTLKYPKSGEYLSAFVFPDMSPHSLGKRAMVFYELSGVSAEPTIWLTFLESNNGKWECTYDIPFFATDIEEVEFALLGDNPLENIIIGYSVLNQPGKNLCVISPSETGQPTQVYRRDFCIYYEIGDFNNSGTNMLLSINGGRGDIIQSTVDFAEWNDGTFYTVYSLRSNPNANKYEKSIKNTYSATIANNEDDDDNDNNDGEENEFLYIEKSALFLEYSLTDAIFGTDIIIWNESFGDRPYNIVYERGQSTQMELLTSLDKRPNPFTAYAYARDINGDRRVNAAGNKLFPGYNDTVSPSERARAAIWYNVDDDNNLEKAAYSYLNVNDDYVFFFPEAWEEAVTVTIDHENNEVVFWKYDNALYESIYDLDKKNEEEQLLKIVSVPKGSAPPKRADWYEFNLYNSSGNNEFDYYVRVLNKSMRPLALRKALKILPVP